MSVNDIIFNINQQIKEEELVPVLSALDKINVDQQTIEAYCDHFDIDINHVYFTSVANQPFVYYKFPIFAQIITFHVSEESTPYDIDRQISYVQKAYNERKWENYLLATEGCCSMMIFLKLFPMLPAKNKYQFLKDFYVQQYHGHTMLTNDMWKEALENRPADYKIELPSEQDVYTIYRGVGSKSASMEDTLSWSIDGHTAFKFAYRDLSNSVIYEAKVKKEHIIDYIDDRNEQEVLVLPKHVFDVKEHKQQNVLNVLSDMNDVKASLEYSYFKNSFLKREYFLQDSPEHGYFHSMRVLFLCMVLAHLKKLNVQDRAILANAAMYHDIGRTNDDVDFKHGQVSVEQIEEQEITFYTLDCKTPLSGEEYELDFLPEEQCDITNRIIAYHSMPDEVGLSDSSMFGLSEENKMKYKELFQLFKDADALDRVRFRDLDMTFLRKDVSKSLITLGMYALDQLK